MDWVAASVSEWTSRFHSLTLAATNGDLIARPTVGPTIGLQLERIHSLALPPSHDDLRRAGLAMKKPGAGAPGWKS